MELVSAPGRRRPVSSSMIAPGRRRSGRSSGAPRRARTAWSGESVIRPSTPRASSCAGLAERVAQAVGGVADAAGARAGRRSRRAASSRRPTARRGAPRRPVRTCRSTGEPVRRRQDAVAAGADRPARRWRSPAARRRVTIASPAALSSTSWTICGPSSPSRARRSRSTGGVEGLQHAPGPCASVGVQPAQLLGDQFGHRQARARSDQSGVLELGQHADRPVVGRAACGPAR